MQVSLLYRTVHVFLFFFLLFGGLHFARPFLFPFMLAAVLAMLLLPLSKRFERKGCNRPVSAILCLTIMLLVLSGIIALLIWQMANIAQDFSQMQQKVMQLVHQVQSAIHQRIGITEQQQKQLLKTSGSSGGGGGIKQILTGTLSMAVDFVLILVYIFIFLISRSHLKTFVLKIVPQNNIDSAEKIIQDSTLVSYKYLSGLAMMIVMLWVLYAIGFSIVGIKNALFFAVLCGILEIIPFVGNLTGTSLTVLMAITQGGGPEMVIGIVLTYFFVQFIQSYLIEPLVVGAEVNINPLFTIVALVIGESVWGVAGLVLAIPLLGMVKIVCDNIEVLKPYGYLIGEKKQTKKGSVWLDKIRKIFR